MREQVRLLNVFQENVVIHDILLLCVCPQEISKKQWQDLRIRVPDREQVSCDHVPQY